MFSRIKYYFIMRKARKRYLMLAAMIDSIDKAFTKKGISRRERRRFWAKFVHNPESRKKFIQEMGKNV